MKSDWKKFIVCFVIIISIFHFATAPTQTTVSEASFTYDGTEFKFFQTSPDINQTDAQTQCTNWGGNLTTIKSDVEDSLLLYSSPDLDGIFSCHIGLNDIDNEAGTNGSVFAWIDGSTSSYRNWGTLLNNNPVATADFDCVRNRYRLADELSQGWLNAPCKFVINCYFCSKPGVTNGCDLAYNSSCYKVFEVSTPINWLDAQSSCAIWGGDLTSITTERENNYLNTLINSSVGNCWIGLNDRDVDGTYTWIDGTTFTLPNFTSIQSNSETNDCVEIDKTGYGWISLGCETTRGSYLCERNSTVTAESRYVVLTNGAVLYQPLISDRFLYNPTLTLVYGIGDFSGLVWKYSTKSNLSDATTLSATFSDSHIEFTSLTIDNAMQGYYYYELSKVSSFIVGLYDASITTVAAKGTTYTYISGVDRQDVLLLCDPNDEGSLNLKWNDTLANPVNIYSERSQFQSEPAVFICTRDATPMVTTLVSVIVPEIFVKYYQFLSSNHTDTSSTNTATIPLSTQQVSLSTNLVGHWNIPGDMNTSSSTVDIGTFLQANAGLYTLYTNNWVGVEVIAMQINIASSPALTAMMPLQEFIFDDTRFGYFSDTPYTNWLNAQLNCISWGGILATIKSEEEDSLLLYTTTDTHFSCYIGLNDILNEANGVEGDYTWVDGSSGPYRNFEQGFPSSNVDRDCVRIRYRMASGDLSQGWVNGVCSLLHNCHFCTKSAISGDCDLIYDGSCYKVFTVITPINWLDAQSSCAIWGGDLTSITSERENNYLNTIIPNTVSNYWIGLNDRSEEDAFTWIDGTAYTLPGFVTVQSNIEANDCVRAINDNNWYPVICTSTQNSFICKASSEITAVERFGELIIGGLDFNSLDVNTFLYRSLTLVCGGQENEVITWRFSENSDLSSDEDLTATYSNTGTRSSWLNVENTKQGYYQCQISSSSYTVGVFDTSVTTVAVSRSTYTYLEGVDRENILLLCDPMDNGILSTLKWDVSYSNPLNIHSVRNTLPTQSTDFSCSRGAGAIVSIFLSVTVPTLVVKYELFVAGSYQLVHPSINGISIPLETLDVSLTMNLVGKWSSPNGVNSTGSTFQISEFMNENSGVYTFYTNNWDGVEVGIQINVTSVPAVVAPIQVLTTTQLQSSIILIVVVIIVSVLIITLAAIAILIPLFICFYLKKRNTNKHPKPSDFIKDGSTGYENLSELHSPSKEYIERPANSNPQYMTIDETSMILLESENEKKLLKYENVPNKSAYTNHYEQISETRMNSNVESKPIVPYERYVPMSSMKEEKKFISKYIPSKEFPATYQQYVASVIQKNSLFSVEFTNLTDNSRINVELDTEEALKVENFTKNPLKNIVPFDENRVVLHSQYFDCNYINANYICENQFIATIHPNKATHLDFLQMIYQTEASMVIMLTTRREKAKIIGGVSNRVCYWPKKDESIKCEPFVTTLINSTETTAFVKQEISLKNTLEGKEHTFTQCISPIWNEDSTVIEIPSAVALLNRILKQLQDDASKSIIIHCEDGISKTGIILAGINSVKELTLKKTINIFNTVKNLRKQRMKMVPTLACYTTCYSLMNEYCSIHL